MSTAILLPADGRERIVIHSRHLEFARGGVALVALSNSEVSTAGLGVSDDDGDVPTLAFNLSVFGKHRQQRGVAEGHVLDALGGVPLFKHRRVSRN